jgi:hypothetical protein
MIPNLRRRRVLGVAAVCAGLGAAAMSLCAGIAAASSTPPAPADIPFLPGLPDPSVLSPAPNVETLLTNTNTIMPLVTDVGSMLSAPPGPGTMLNDAGTILSDVGSMLSTSPDPDALPSEANNQPADPTAPDDLWEPNAQPVPDA